MEKHIFKDIKTKIGSQGFVLMVVIVFVSALLIFTLKNSEKTGSNIAEVIDSADEDFDEFHEEVEDKINDHTDSK